MESAENAASTLLDFVVQQDRVLRRSHRLSSLCDLNHVDHANRRVCLEALDLADSLAAVADAGVVYAAFDGCGPTTAIKTHGTKREKDYHSNPKMVEKAIRLAFKISDEEGGGEWSRGYAHKVAREVGINYKTIQRWCEPHDTVDEALHAAQIRKKGHATVTPVEVEKRLYTHIVSCWKSGSTPTRAYVIAQWTRMCKATGVEWDNAIGIPSDKAYRRFCTTWHPTERIPNQHTWRRAVAETPENIRGFFDGKTETIAGNGADVPDITVRWRGVKEVMAMSCDTRDGKNRSFADCLIADEERAVNGDEICIMKAAKEQHAVGPEEAVQFCRQWDGDRTSITGFVSGGNKGTIAPRYYIKKGKVWTYDYMDKCGKESKLKLKADGYTMDGETLVEILTHLAKFFNVTPRYRALFFMDGHGSRLEAAVADAIEKLGWVLVLFPGCHTHILQPMDAVFQEVRRIYMDLMALARSNNFGSVRVDDWLGCWDKACVGALGGEEGRKVVAGAFKTCGLWPVNYEHVVDRVGRRKESRILKMQKKRERPNVPATDDPRLEIVLQRKRRRKQLNAMLEELEEENHENAEEGGQKVKHKRVEHPTLVGSDEHKQVIAHKATIAQAAKDAATNKDDARAAKAAAAAAAKQGAARVQASLAQQRSANATAPGQKKAQKPKTKKTAGGLGGACCPDDFNSAAEPVATAPAWHNYPMIFADVPAPAQAHAKPEDGA